MIDWELILKDLGDMRVHFDICKSNAAPGSKAEAQYAGYVRTIDILMESIRDMLRCEDDGR